MKPGLVAAVVVSFALPVSPAGSFAPGPDTPAAQSAIVGLSVRGAHRAYPTSLFAAQRVMNDVLGGMEIAIFHDPEHGFSAAWFRTVFGEPIQFSGLTRGGVADDLTTMTQWDLTTGVAVGGNLQGQRLVPLSTTTTSWAGWSAAHPDGQIYSQAP